MANKTGRGTFQKGDTRINRKGRPSDFNAARALGQQIANEELTGKDGEPVIINGHRVTKIEAILRSWAQSKDPRLQIFFFEIAYGKVPNPVEISGPDKSDITINVVDYRHGLAAIAPDEPED